MTKNKQTLFESKWGIRADELARSECITVDGVHMRVYLWGNPFQRRAKPTKWEREIGVHPIEISADLGVHPATIANWLVQGFNPYRKVWVTYAHRMSAEQRARQAVNPDRSVWNNRIYRKILKASVTFWLHPKHPDYAQARKGLLTDKLIKETYSWKARFTNIA